jgi:hypothetical protein
VTTPSGAQRAIPLGLVYSVRHRLRDVLPILAFTVTLTLAYALMQGNTGTAYRQRTQVTMFFFVFIGLGIVEKQRRRALAAGTTGFDHPPTIATPADRTTAASSDDNDLGHRQRPHPAERS